MSRRRLPKVLTSPVVVRELTADELCMLICAVEDRAMHLRDTSQTDRAADYEALRRLITTSPAVIVARER